MLDDLAQTPHDVLVNTTSVGLKSDSSPVRSEWIDAPCVVMDAVYQPERTRFLRDADARGARCIPGKWMLVHQAVAQLSAWAGADWSDDTRQEIAEVMSEAFDAAGR